jgi:predicted permease
MKALRRFLNRLAGSTTRRHDEERLREELDAHVAMQAAEYVRTGLSPDEARRQALLRVGPTEAIRASYRDEQRLPALDDLVQDVRYALRQLRKTPVFTLTATMSLALGIGASAAVFTVIERVLLRPLPVSNPHELVYITDERIILTQASPRFSYPFYTIVRDTNTLDGVTARAAVSLSARVNGQIVRVSGELVSGSYFSVIGAGTQLGRPLSAEDDRTPGAHPVTVISDRTWRRTFGSDASVIGRRVQLNEHAFTIVGVAAKDFTGTDVGLPTDIWLPMTMQREVGRDLLTEARTNWLEILGRLAPGMTRERAAGQLTTQVQRRTSELPPSQVSARRLVLTPGDKGNSPLRRELGPALAVLMALTGLAMGLACINVASLVSVRSAPREKEIAIRSALGARRSRLTRQLLTEGLVLAALGGTAGLLVAPWAARLLVASQSRPLDIDASMDARVLVFGLLVSMLTGLIVAQASIFGSRGVGLAQLSEKSSGPSAISRRLSAHDLIVTLQIAMALAMLINAALLVQSIRSFNSVDPGFRADNLILATLDPKAAGYDSDRIDGFWRNTLEQVRQIPGVQSVSLAGTVPLAPGRQRQRWLHPTSGERVELDTNFVGPRYFRTLAVPLVHGREFDDKDGRTSRPVVIVNERLALMFWPEQDPIGKGIRLPDSGNPLAEVIGVARDVKSRDLRGDTDPMFYRPVLQTRSTDAMTLHVRASSDPGELVSGIRLAVQDVDPNVPLFQVTTLDEQLDASFAQTRQAALLTGVFGMLALLLSGIGVYGVTALAVSRRTRDIGIRMALGARPRDIVRTVGARAITLAGAGLGLGLVGSLGFTQVTGTLLFGVTAADSATFAGMAALLALVSLLAFSIPLRAATRLDAVAAIRRE